MKNKLTDLNNHLFETLERLNDDELTGEQLQQEINRSKAITDVAEKLIDNGNLILKAVHEQNEYGGGSSTVPKMLLGQGKDDSK